MLLALTASGDGTIDRLVRRIGAGVFRYNFDQVDQFSALITPDYWEIENPAGRRITSETATAALWWKAFIDRPDGVDAFIFEEAKYIFRELYARLDAKGKVKGNSSTFHHRFGKIRVLALASKYFKTPPTAFTWGKSPNSVVPPGNRVVKSLSSALMSDGRTLFTTDVSGRQLDPKFPWLTQEKVDATHDVTVLLVGTQLFAFCRDRVDLKGLDWRAEQTFEIEKEEWHPFALASKHSSAFSRLASDMGVDWGRFDLMLTGTGDLVFLEFNANGQWVFLDYHDRYGLLDAVVGYLQA